MDMAKRYGEYDGDPAVWNDAYAWVFTNGVWHKIEAFLAIQDARVMPAAEWKEVNAKLPPMPKEAFKSP